MLFFGDLEEHSGHSEICRLIWQAGDSAGWFS